MATSIPIYINDKGEFQAGDFPPDSVLLSLKHPLAHDILWEFADRLEATNQTLNLPLAAALKERLMALGFAPTDPPWIDWARERLTQIRDLHARIAILESETADAILFKLGLRDSMFRGLIFSIEQAQTFAMKLELIAEEHDCQGIITELTARFNRAVENDLAVKAAMAPPEGR